MSSLVFLLQLPPKLRTPELAETEEVPLRTPGGPKGVAEVEKKTPRPDIEKSRGGAEVSFSMEVEKVRQQMGRR
jgi:hypothetical protein